MAPRRFEELSATGGSVPALDRVEVVPLEPKLLSETDLASCAPKKVRTTSQASHRNTTTSAQVSRSTEVANTAGA